MKDSGQICQPGCARTSTWDQGEELVLRQQVTGRTGTGVFFGDAHSPWQLGTNENMNGVLRDCSSGERAMATA